VSSAAPTGRHFSALLATLHALDFRYLLPWLGRLPKWLGEPLALLRGALRARLQADWRSVALGYRHVAARSETAFRELAPDAGALQRRAWLRERFLAEARDEFEARWLAEGRCDDLHCHFVPADGPRLLLDRPRGLVLLTTHHESFFLGIRLLAGNGATVNVMTSAVTHDPRVAASVSAHFKAKYAGLERYLNGGRLIDLEDGVRPFYRMLERGETLVVLADAPVLPQGARLEVDFLGARRALAGGAVRIARRTGSDLGAYACRCTGPRLYTLRMSGIGPAREPASVDQAYGFLSQVILDDPGGWWAADLLPDMPAVVPAPAPPEQPMARPTTAGTRVPDSDRGYQVLVLGDSELAGSAELSFGIAQLKRTLHAVVPPQAWTETPRAAAPSPASLLAQIGHRRLLVVLQPAVLVTPGLPLALAQGLGTTALCAVAASQHGPGPLPPAYVTLADLEAYVERRGTLPMSQPWTREAHGRPEVFMVDAAALPYLDPGLEDWAQVPAQLAAHAVLAPRAYVHAYDDYRRHERDEMLELVPIDVQRLLDIGGGEGVFARAFVRRRGGAAWVLEPDPAGAARARAAGLHVLECRLQDLDGAFDASFDAVTLLDVFEHLEDSKQALQVARRLLRPGGVLVISTPNLGHWPIVRDLAMGRFDYTPVGSLCWTHVRFFTEASLTAMLNENGFTVEQVAAEPAPADAALEHFIEAAAAAGLRLDRRSLHMPALRVRARVD